MSFWSRVVNSLRGERLNREIDEEFQSHIEEAIAAGRDPVEARRAFGSAMRASEVSHAVRVSGGLEVFAQDVRFGMRLLFKNPGFTVVTVLTLALGIGVNTAIFSVVNGVLLNPLPFPHPDQLVAVHESKPNFANGSISYPNFLDWRKDNHTFAAMGLARGYGFSMTGRGDAEQLDGEFLSDGFFAVLGVRPVLGREFTLADETPGAAPVVMISEGLWRRKFNGAPNVLDQMIALDGKSFSVVGVIPASLKLRVSNFQASGVYAPITQWSNSMLMNRGAGLGFHGMGRLKPDVTIEQARADLERVTRNLTAAFPDADRGIGASIVPMKEQIVGSTRGFLLILLGAVGFVLLIACVNVSSLQLARASGRGREFAVRAALGASRGRIIRQLLTESLLLGITAGVVGLLPAAFGLKAALHALPNALPRAEEIGLDLRVLSFTALISIVTGLLFGLAPAWRVSNENPQAMLKEGGRGTIGTRQRTLSAFVIVEVAVALVLLTGAGLMVRSLVRLWDVDPGFNAHNIETFSISMPTAMASATPDMIRAKHLALNDALAGAPGVAAVSQTWGAVPLSGEDDQWFWIDGQPKPQTNNEMSWVIDYIVDPDYQRVMQIPLIRGRFLTRHDDEHAPLVVVVDEVFANKYFPGQDPVGKRIHIDNYGGKAAEIVGVAGHVKQWGLDSDDTQQLRAQYYLACMQVSDDLLLGVRMGTSVMVRYKGSLAPVIDGLRTTIRRMSNEQVLFGEEAMENIVADSMASRRFAMILLGSFAALALLLACVGIYGVMAYLVSQRTQEIGIRMALGAGRSDVLLLVFKGGARLAAIGVMIGLMSSIGLTRLMRELLFNVSPTDPVVIVAVCVLLMLVAAVACLVPARRAASIEPTQALRTE
jgi:predicted permease